MTKRSIIIDCDPGQDDAVCLFLALASQDQLDVVGITTVAGNVPLDLTQRNARLICDLARCTDVPIFAGCDRPLERELLTAEPIHGCTGINGIEIFEPITPLQQQHAVDFIIETLLTASENSTTLVATGPLTNVATAINRKPAILNSIKEIVLMGGAMREGGNSTPSAEFNMYVDPQAADIVLKCGRPLTLMGLDVTHQVLTTPDRIRRIAALHNPVADAAVGMLEFFHQYDTQKYASQGSPLHDPCTVAYLLEPELFETKACNVTIETESELTLGHTAVDFWHVTDLPINANWAHTVNTDRFYTLLIERLARFDPKTI